MPPKEAPNLKQTKKKPSDLYVLHQKQKVKVYWKDFFTVSLSIVWRLPKVHRVYLWVYFTATAQSCCVADYVVVIPLSRGWLRLYVAGSGPRRSWRWFRTLPRWPVWRRLPTVMLCRYTGSTKWLSNAPCRPRMFHLGVGRRWEEEKREEVKEGREEKGWKEQHSWKRRRRCECRMRCVGERRNETQQLAKDTK